MTIVIIGIIVTLIFIKLIPKAFKFAMVFWAVLTVYKFVAASGLI